MDNDQLDELERRAMQWFRDADGYEYPIDGDNLLALITAARRPEVPPPQKEWMGLAPSTTHNITIPEFPKDPDHG